jgi:hypothetical protein
MRGGQDAELGRSQLMPPVRPRTFALWCAFICADVALLLLVLLLPQAPESSSNTHASRHRVVMYYQTQFDRAGSYVSPLPLARSGVTDVIVGAFHLNDDGIYLNDDPPDVERNTRLWADLRTIQAAGVRVSAMIGGAAPGSFQRLDSEFEFGRHYPRLRNLLRSHRFDGVDLDIEESMSLAGVKRVIDALRADFGSTFILTLAPVATALAGGRHLSGFNYDKLWRDRGEAISWFNVQFYNGWGSLDDTSDVEAILGRSVISADKLVIGTLTSPSNGTGYVSSEYLRSTLRQLVRRYPDLGGVAGWEYFNSLPGDTAAPWQWSAEVSAELR